MKSFNSAFLPRCLFFRVFAVSCFRALSEYGSRNGERTKSRKGEQDGFVFAVRVARLLLLLADRLIFERTLPGLPGSPRQVDSPVGNLSFRLENFSGLIWRNQGISAPWERPAHYALGSVPRRSK
jgi:hypothetical protein